MSEMFKLQNTELIETDLNDFQHKVERLIRNHKDEEGFPLIDDFNLAQEELDDYLFERQAILDSKGTERKRYTIAGVLIVLPVLIMSAFPEEKLPWGSLTVLVGIACGLVLFLIYLGLQKAIINYRLKRLDSRFKAARRFVDEVLKFDL